jgi:hypothetical protein
MHLVQALAVHDAHPMAWHCEHKFVELTKKPLTHDEHEIFEEH